MEVMIFTHAWYHKIDTSMPRSGHIVFGVVFPLAVVLLVCCIRCCCRNFNIRNIGKRGNDLASGMNVVNDESGTDNSITKCNLPSTDFESKFIKVNIETGDGELRVLPVFNTITVTQLKRLISRYYEIPMYKQEILFNKKQCDVALKLIDHGIEDGDTIQVIELDDDDDDSDDDDDADIFTTKPNIDILLNDECAI
eukprot:CAMPEP_0202691130 /NCGR_PEP_ID=MMETSP1385-20130828/5925_1 /ASSEMBLY_ACC=CAM_ASM_000861 /TAXON_ID=933848 /ORGANISM="Elphidium margaritaceum" /LENGTH=195 /DNA_ID=CAMNT_0049346485 /DNA_START=54 /DNA_END=641 /DNA_ORIENTATION=+